MRAVSMKEEIITTLREALTVLLVLVFGVLIGMYGTRESGIVRCHDQFETAVPGSWLSSPWAVQCENR